MFEDTKLVEKCVGIKIQQRRKKLHLSQAELGEIIGLSAQQVQRYESGENSVPLSKLMWIANALNVKPNYFLDEIALQKTYGQSNRVDTISRGLNRKLQVLLVEDDANDAGLFIKACDRSSIECDVFHLLQADKLLDFMNQPQKRHGAEYPDIIILDINMPRVDGIAALASIKESPHNKVPVIMLTNSIRSKDMLKCYENGVSGFVQKSADLYQYNDDVDRILTYWSQLCILPQTA